MILVLKESELVTIVFLERERQQWWEGRVVVFIRKDVTASSGLAVPFLGTYPVSYLSAGHTVFSQEIQVGHLIRLPKAITRGAQQGSYHQFW